MVYITTQNCEVYKIEQSVLPQQPQSCGEGILHEFHQSAAKISGWLW